MSANPQPSMLSGLQLKTAGNPLIGSLRLRPKGSGLGGGADPILGTERRHVPLVKEPSMESESTCHQSPRAYGNDIARQELSMFADDVNGVIRYSRARTHH